MSLEGRIDSLRTRHAALQERIDSEFHRPAPDQPAMTALKLEKLRVKEELDRLRH